jgi:hypothetical protein
MAFPRKLSSDELLAIGSKQNAEPLATQRIGDELMRAQYLKVLGTEDLVTENWLKIKNCSISIAFRYLPRKRPASAQAS